MVCIQTPVKQAKEAGPGRSRHATAQVVKEIIQRHRIPIGEKFIAFESVVLAKECISESSFKHHLRGTIFIFTGTIIFRRKFKKLQFATSGNPPDMVLHLAGIKHVRASKTTLSLHLHSEGQAKLATEPEKESNNKLSSSIFSLMKSPFQCWNRVSTFTTASIGGKSVIIFTFRDHNACLRTKKAIAHMMDTVAAKAPGFDRQIRRVSRTYTPNVALIECPESDIASPSNPIKRTASLRGKILENKDACAWFEIVMSESEEESLAVLLKHSDFCNFKAGTVILDLGDEVKKIYSIFSGHVVCKGADSKVSLLVSPHYLRMLNNALCR